MFLKTDEIFAHYTVNRDQVGMDETRTDLHLTGSSIRISSYLFYPESLMFARSARVVALYRIVRPDAVLTLSGASTRPRPPPPPPPPPFFFFPRGVAGKEGGGGGGGGAGLGWEAHR